MKLIVFSMLLIMLTPGLVSAEVLMSTSLAVQIGMLDKFNDGNIKNPHVVVIGPDGTTYRSKSMETSKNDGYHTCYFPVDFMPGFNGKKGKYTWKSYSKNKEIASGKFIYEMKTEKKPKDPYSTTESMILSDLTFAKP